jgi:hypothetical protein
MVRIKGGVSRTLGLPQQVGMDLVDAFDGLTGQEFGLVAMLPAPQRSNLLILGQTLGRRRATKRLGRLMNLAQDLAREAPDWLRREGPTAKRP